MSSTETTSAFNLDALLDGTLDDLADVPVFETFHAGAHKVTINWKKVDKKPAYSLCLTLIETVELANAEDTPQKPGTQTSVMFMLDNEYGQSAFRKIIASLAEHFGAGTNREILEKSEGAEVVAVTKKRANKEKTAEYTDIVAIGVV